MLLYEYSKTISSLITSVYAHWQQDMNVYCHINTPRRLNDLIDFTCDWLTFIAVA